MTSPVRVHGRVVSRRWSGEGLPLSPPPSPEDERRQGEMVADLWRFGRPREWHLTDLGAGGWVVLIMLDGTWRSASDIGPRFSHAATRGHDLIAELPYLHWFAFGERLEVVPEHPGQWGEQSGWKCWRLTPGVKPSANKEEPA